MKKTGWSNKTKSLRKVGKVMHEFKEGELHVGKSDKVVKNPKQAIAIALSEAGMSKKVKGGGVKYYTKENEYRLGRPSGSIEKEILDKVTFKNAISEQYFVGSFGWKTTQGKLGDGYLYTLDEFDQDLTKDLKLKSGEKIFRYVNRTTAIGGMTPFIKINLEKGLLYFPVYNDNDDVMFETKGVNPLWINIIEDKMETGGGVGENTKIKDWYTKEYSSDDLGEELDDNVTFTDLMNALNDKKYIYEVMGVGDSVIRERLFERLSEIFGVSYDEIYKKWLESDDFAKGGGVDETYSKRQRNMDYKNIIQKNEKNVFETSPNTLIGKTVKIKLPKGYNFDITEDVEFKTKVTAEYANMIKGSGKYSKMYDKKFIVEVYANGGGIKDSATIIVISQNKPLAKQIGTGWDDIYNSYGVSLVEKDGKKYIVFTYNYVSQVDRYVITDDISYIMKTYGISNVEWDNLSDKRYALEMSKNEYSKGGGIDYLDNEFWKDIAHLWRSEHIDIDENGKWFNTNKYKGVNNTSGLYFTNDSADVIVGLANSYNVKLSDVKNKNPQFTAFDYYKNEIESRRNKKYSEGGGVDINDWDLPVIRSQFEEEEFEYGGGGAIFSRTMKTPDGTIVGKVDYNDFWKTYQVVIDGVVYEEFKTKEEAIQNLKNAGFGKMQLGGGIPNNYFGKTPEEVWNEWTETQRLHFLIDHRLTDLHSSKIMIPFSELPESIKRAVKFHRAEGQYADGGEVDINDWDMPVIRTQFEDEEYEFEKGGEITAEERKQSLKNNLKLKF